ncbi:LPXTG cell wall anchor domain-containing protein [Listeria fleischmannii]|uniref:LPXTG cell wall anchor domain-containing protein n=1 Tax=Listeria fleischmannii TaxID=1069827 RepID=UPI00098D2F87|nr:immunoglobulin-like domain-containing protein [Listeria fleischmannii]
MKYLRCNRRKRNLASTECPFDPMSTMAAKDIEDGDLLAHVQITANNVDTSKPMYEVMDRDGNTAMFTRQVVVTEASTITGEETITLNQGDLFDAMHAVTAQDKEDGNLMKQIAVLASDVNVNVPGTYHVTYNVVDSNGNSAMFTRTVVVKAVAKPVQPVVIHPDADLIVVQPAQEKAALPKTGDQSFAPVGLVGLALLAFRGFLFWRKK